MNEREQKLVEALMTEAKQQREDALKNAKVALEESFPKRSDTIRKMVEEDKIASEEVNEVLDELEHEEVVDKELEYKKPSFFQNLSHSFHRETINGRNSFKNRFRLLAGIKTNPAVARLTIKEGVVIDLIEIPKWYDIIRYKLCGFKYEVLIEKV